MLPMAKTGISYGRNGVARGLDVLDVGSSIFINGMQFSPDLSQCFGFKDDALDLMHALAAFGQSSDPTNVVTGRVGYNASGLLNDRVTPSVALSNGKMLTYSSNYVACLAQDVPGYLIVVNPSNGRVESSQLLTNVPGMSSQRAFHKMHFVDTGSVILGFISFDDQTNALNSATIFEREYVLVINRNTGYATSCVQLMSTQTWSGVSAFFNIGADSAMVYFVSYSSGGQPVVAYSSIGSTTGATSKGISIPVTTNNMLQANYCLGKAANSFYSVYAGSSNDKFILYVQGAIPAANTTAVVCTLSDNAPLLDMGATASSNTENGRNAAYEAKVLTVAGVDYLVVLTRITFSGQSGTISQYGMFAYKIDATDPTKLTLVAYQKFATPPSLACFDPSGTIWVYLGGTLTTYTFTGTAFLAGAQVSIASITDIVFTQQGTVLAIDKINRYVYNVTVPTAYVIDCYFQESQMQYESSALVAHVVVNVYDGTGARQVQTVQLLLQGGTFQAGGTSVSVTTSATGDTIVPVIVSNPGLIAVTPSLQ